MRTSPVLLKILGFLLLAAPVSSQTFVGASYRMFTDGRNSNGGSIEVGGFQQGPFLFFAQLAVVKRHGPSDQLYNPASADPFLNGSGDHARSEESVIDGTGEVLSLSALYAGSRWIVVGPIPCSAALCRGHG